MEKETRVMLPKDKKHQGLPKTGKGKERSSPRGFGKTIINTLISDFKPPKL
jgi:hypothetical protein